MIFFAHFLLVFFARFLARYYFKFCTCFWILYVLLPCSFAGEEFAREEEEEEVTGEALAYIAGEEEEVAGEEEEVAGEEFTGASERRGGRRNHEGMGGEEHW